jgi:hypothetical protein
MISAASVDLCSVPTGEVRHSREVPPEWQDLLDQTTALVMPNGEPLPVTEEMARQAVHLVENLPVERLEENRYFGTGLLICKFAQALYQPGAREALIPEVARTILDACYEKRGKQDGVELGDPLVLSDVSPKTARDLFGALLLDAASAMPPNERLLTDALTTVSMVRVAVTEAAKEGGVGSEMLRALLRYPWHQKIKTDMVVEGTATTVPVRNVTQSGVRGTLLQAIAAEGLAQSTLAQIVESGILGRALNYRKLGVGLGRLRLDEFNCHELVNMLVTSSKRGELIISPAYLHKPPADGFFPSSENVGSPIHHARLTCPAIQVERLIPAMLELDARVLAEVQRQHEVRRGQSLGAMAITA